MATPLEATSEGAGEDCVDYTELLRVSLRQQKLMYIADIVSEVEDETLDNLMTYSQNDLTELLADIHNDKENEHKIKSSHRNKFARTVIEIANRKKQASKETATATSANTGGSKMKLLIIGKEEEEAIEAIQGGQKFMDQNVVKMKELFNNLDENNKNIKQNLDTICNSLKQRIDAKQKEMVQLIDGLYQYHLNKLNQRNEVTQQSSNVVAKFYNDYESYFNDDKLTKQDRKEKLVAAKDSIAVEVDKLKKYEDVIYEMNVALNKNAVNQFFDQCVHLSNIGDDIAAITTPKKDDMWTIKWEEPKVGQDVVNILRQQDDDNKDEKEISISYQILYRGRDGDKNEEKKEEIEWNRIDNLINMKQYDMMEYCAFPIEAKISYTINGMLQSPASGIVAISKYVAKWSEEHKGSTITLSENNTKALLSGNDQNIRAVHPIPKGMIVKLNFTVYYTSMDYELLGLVSSEWNGNWKSSTVPQCNSDLGKYVYGLRACVHNSYQHFVGEQGYKNLGWNAGKIPKNTEVTIQMVVDYKTCDTCSLSFYRDGDLKGQMKLPKLENDHVWYPFTCFDYDKNWCKIESI